MNGEYSGRNEDAREIERLHAQVRALQEELALRKGSEGKKVEPGTSAVEHERPESAGRRISSLILLIIGIVALFVAIPVLWLNHTLLTTDGWVEAVGPVTEDPAVQDAVANAVVQEYSRQENIRAWVQEQLPEKSEELAGPIITLLQMAARQVVKFIISTDAFEGIWTEANRLSHSLAMAGFTRADQIDGQLVERAESMEIDLQGIIETLRQELQRRGLGFILPEGITAQLAILQSERFVRFLNILKTLNTAAPWLALITLVAIAGSLVLSYNRRKTVLFLGVGIISAGLILLIASFIVKMRMVGQVPPDALFTSEATSQAYDTITGGLLSTLGASLLLGIILCFGAYALGPSLLMTRMRRRVRLWIYQLGGDRAPGRVGGWIKANRNKLQAAVLILAGFALLLPVGRSVIYVVWLTVGVVFLEFLIEFFGRTAPPPLTT
ncbi:MAG: hypothetical protein GX089_09415 [Fibrobacter sp.]|nr:hypothetical protein [Fibrobacter sp.]